MRRGALALLLAALGLTGAAAAGAAPAPSPNLSAYLHGKRLGGDPQLRHGDVVRVVVTGFAGAASVQVRLGGTSAHLDRQADPSGTLTYIYVVPADLADGDYVLTFVGPGPQRRYAPPATGTMNHDGVIVVAPNGGFFPFYLRTHTPSATPSPTPSAAATGTQRPTPAGGLPNTGTDLRTPLLIGALAVIAGAAAVGLGLRPPRRGRPEPDR